MAANHKLTAVIQGRTIAGAQDQDGKLLLSFTDGSTMTVKTGGSAQNPSASGMIKTGGTVKSVRQAGTTLALDLEDGSTITISTAEPTASVMVRDKNHTLEYAD